MPPPPNHVLFTLYGDPWRLSGVCFVAAVAIFGVGVTSTTMLIRRHGVSRLLSRAEAASVAMAWSLRMPPPDNSFALWCLKLSRAEAASLAIASSNEVDWVRSRWRFASGSGQLFCRAQRY
ncbi:MAG: hypothetical protein JWN04_1067 [Myxococcaceae bacterium]|nr:hypothetical protein [Myxococcaceae bacterium]